MAGCPGHLAVNARDISFLDKSFFELQAQMPLRRSVARKDHDPGCGMIQSMHKAQFRIKIPKTGFEAVFMFFGFTGHAEQAARLIDDQEIIVQADNRERVRRRSIDKRLYDRSSLGFILIPCRYQSKTNQLRLNQAGHFFSSKTGSPNPKDFKPSSCVSASPTTKILMASGRIWS